ncbi:MAG: DUF4276 family protein [Blastocatellia bacterium]|nr:DUF4276 family protein [Blastocatellia bacterium]
MTRVLVLVEGQTEELFVKRILTPYLLPFNVFPQATIIHTRKVQDAADFKGGRVSWGKVNPVLKQLLNDRNAALVTTFFDYYGLHKDFPKPEAGDCYQKVLELEAWVAQKVKDERLFPYFSLHEFEAMMFVRPEELATQTDRQDMLTELQAVKAQRSSPEEINDHPDTAPSRRIKKLIPDYKKTGHGISIIQNVGLDAIRAECPHFNKWLTKLESIGQISS